MSDQRRMRSELRQGLHQYLMALYHSYLQTQTHEQAITLIAEGISDEYKYFTKQIIKKEPSLEIETSIKEIERLARNEQDSVKQHELYEDYEALMNAQEVLAKYTMTEDVK